MEIQCSNCGLREKGHPNDFIEEGWRTVGDAKYCSYCVATWQERNGKGSSPEDSRISMIRLHEEYIRRKEDQTKEALATIRCGDVVKVVNCYEESLFKDKTFKVESEPRKIGATYCVRLGGVGYFDISRLQKV